MRINLSTGVGVVVVLAGIAIGAGAGLSFVRGKAVSAKIASLSVPGEYTNEEIERLKKELDETANYEASYGCMTFGVFGDPEFCGESKEKIDALHSELVDAVRELELSKRSDQDIASVKIAITQATGAAGELVFEGTSANPYTNTVKRIEQWSDARGFFYIVDPSTNGIVQFGPGPNSTMVFERDGGKSLSEDALQKTADDFLASQVKDFETVKAEYQFTSMSKPGNATHAFRWESKSVPEGEAMAPFVQVVLSPIGEIMSFADTRSLYAE